MLSIKRTVGFFLVSFSIILSLVFFYYEQLVKLTTNIDLALLVGFAAIASGVSGVIMTLSLNKVANFEAIREYFQQGDATHMMLNRQAIYEYEESDEENKALDEKAAVEICSFYHFWGMMVKKRFLPLWIFKGASGVSGVRLHTILQPYINEKKLKKGYYADGFDILVERIKKKYRY